MILGKLGAHFNIVNRELGILLINGCNNDDEYNLLISIPRAPVTSGGGALTTQCGGVPPFLASRSLSRMA